MTPREREILEYRGWVVFSELPLIIERDPEYPDGLHGRAEGEAVVELLRLYESLHDEFMQETKKNYKELCKDVTTMGKIIQASHEAGCFIDTRTGKRTNEK